MKYTLIPATLLLSLGVAQAGSGWDTEQGRDAYHSDCSSSESQSMQSTAVQPGIGDKTNQFDDATDRKYDLTQDDWTDLRNEEIYGSF